MTKLNKHGKKVLKSIQHLPDRTADEAVYYLLGEIPIQARIDRQGLILLAGIARNEGIGKDLAMRQLSIKKRNSNSWFVRVDQTLSKYGLRSAIDIITNPPQAEAWKTEIDDAIWGFWHKKRLESASTKPSLRYLNLDLDPRRPHHVWTSVKPTLRDVRAASIKAKLLTGSYTLQANRARFNQYDVNPTCIVCKQEPEGREHFLLRCEGLADTRKIYIDMLKDNIYAYYDTQTWDALIGDENHLLQCILDCTKCEILKPPPNDDRLIENESSIRWWCAALHKQRDKILAEKAKAGDIQWFPLPLTSFFFFFFFWSFI